MQKNAENLREARGWAIKEDEKDLKKFLGIEIQAPSPQPPIVYDMEDAQETAIPICMSNLPVNLRHNSALT
jgi:hypothetical protein